MFVPAAGSPEILVAHCTNQDGCAVNNAKRLLGGLKARPWLFGYWLDLNVIKCREFAAVGNSFNANLITPMQRHSVNLMAR